MQYDAKQWATIHLGRKHYKAIQNSKIKHTSRYNIAQHNCITYIWIQCYTVQHDALQFNTTQRSTTQHDAMWCKALQYTQQCHTLMLWLCSGIWICFFQFWRQCKHSTPKKGQLGTDMVEYRDGIPKHSWELTCWGTVIISKPKNSLEPSCYQKQKQIYPIGPKIADGQALVVSAGWKERGGDCNYIPRPN